MRVVVQRVSRASVAQVGGAEALRAQVAEARRAEIGAGLVVLAGFTAADTPETLQWMAEKCVHLRVFADDAGAMNRSVLDVGGALLVVPNFTLYGDARKGRRPSFTEAAPPEVAERLFTAFAAELRSAGARVETGYFREHMHVELVNDGPVTLFIERNVERNAERNAERNVERNVERGE